MQMRHAGVPPSSYNSLVHQIRNQASTNDRPACAPYRTKRSPRSSFLLRDALVRRFSAEPPKTRRSSGPSDPEPAKSWIRLHSARLIEPCGTSIHGSISLKIANQLVEMKWSQRLGPELQQYTPIRPIQCEFHPPSCLRGCPERFHP